MSLGRLLATFLCLLRHIFTYRSRTNQADYRLNSICFIDLLMYTTYNTIQQFGLLLKNGGHVCFILSLAQEKDPNALPLEVRMSGSPLSFKFPAVICICAWWGRIETLTIFCPTHETLQMQPERNEVGNTLSLPSTDRSCKLMEYLPAYLPCS